MAKLTRVAWVEKTNDERLKLWPTLTAKQQDEWPEPVPAAVAVQLYLDKKYGKEVKTIFNKTLGRERMVGWKDKLTKAQLKHCREMKIRSLAALKRTRNAQRESDFRCYECSAIARAVGIEKHDGDNGQVKVGTW